MFITLEGIEGCGKTTQGRILAEELSRRGFPVVTTREPGGCPLSDRIRSILLDADNHDMVPRTELFLYAAARAQHVAQVVKPALAEGKIVVCDRFTDATLAYQGGGRGLSREVILQLNDLATEGTAPDLTVLFDCPVETGLARARARIEAAEGPREERFELESVRFHERVRGAYREMAAREPDRFVVIPAEGGITETADRVREALLPRITARA